MIKVTRKENGVHVEGHAYSGKPGEDIICSAASILAHTLAYNLRDLQDMGILTDLDIDLGHGNASISYSVADDRGAIVQLVVDTVMTGYHLLAASYPDKMCMG